MGLKEKLKSMFVPNKLRVAQGVQDYERIVEWAKASKIQTDAPTVDGDKTRYVEIMKGGPGFDEAKIAMRPYPLSVEDYDTWYIKPKTAEDMQKNRYIARMLEANSSFEGPRSFIAKAAAYEYDDAARKEAVLFGAGPEGVVLNDEPVRTGERIVVTETPFRKTYVSFYTDAHGDTLSQRISEAEFDKRVKAGVTYSIDKIGFDEPDYRNDLGAFLAFGAGPEGVVDTSVHPGIVAACNRMAAEEHAGLCSNLQAPPAGPFLGLTMMEAQEVHRATLGELKLEREYSENLRKRCEELAAEVKAQKERYDVLASSQALTAERVMYIHGTGQGQHDAGLPCPTHDGTAPTAIRILGWRSRN